jgi:hypothetical protein
MVIRVGGPAYTPLQGPGRANVDAVAHPWEPVSRINPCISLILAIAISL